MFPNFKFLTMSWYDIFLLFGIVGAFVVFRLYSDRKNISAKLHNFCLLVAVAAIVVGFFCAVLFQAVYDFTKTGEFVVNKNTGMTFYGGFIGGAVTFVGLYFTVGRKLCQDALSRWKDVLGIASCSVALAHAFGRMGCFLVGCCYGKPASSPLGVYFPALGYTAIPTQLYECAFLLLLFVLLSLLLFKSKLSPLPVYLSAYGVFRFCIEFFRNDDRGASVISALSPSQCWAIVLFLVGVCFISYGVFAKRKE